MNKRRNHLQVIAPSDASASPGHECSRRDTELLIMDRHFPSPDRVRELLRDRIDIKKRGVGGIISVIEPAGDFTVAHGYLTHGASPKINRDTIFGVGCVSKVLTGILCAEMLERGEIRLSDPLAEYLPSDVATTGRNGVAITLEHLVTHNAGLPAWELDPFASIDRLYDFVREYVPGHDVGMYHEYSTVGFALLGLALAHRAGKTHETLIRERVCTPLGMVDTSVEVPPAALSRVAVGHDAGLAPLPPSPVVVATGGHGFHSTASDLIRLLSACVGKRTTPLDAAIRQTMSLRRTGAPGISDIAMAWHVGTVNGIDMFSHDGISTGHRAFIGIVPALGRAVAAMVNGIAPIGLTDIARHLLNPDCALLPNDFTLLRPARSAPPSLSAAASQGFDSYAGIYQLIPGVRVEVVSDDGGLQLKIGPDTQRIFPHGEGEFWLPASGPRLDGVVRFERSGECVTAMVVSDPGRTRRLTRVDEGPARVWHGRWASGSDAVALNQYLGRYKVGDYVLEIKGAGQTLSAAWIWAGQSPPTGTHALGVAGKGRPLPLVHERDHRFMVDAEDVDVSLTFETDGRSPARAVWCEIEQEVAHGARIPSMIA
jgi:D-alanyl-D-alanine-carboxypeptidase/D-alanyl-D-alanine-endopeptidase